jgi:hypothetical protein
MAFPLDSSPATFWTLRKDGNTRSAEVRFVPIGVEVRILRNDGGLLYSRIFATGDEAVSWANEERDDLLGQGWTELRVGVHRPV